MSEDVEPLIAKIPVDIDQSDKILYQLTARQVAVLTAGATLAFALYLAVAASPVAVQVAVVFPVVVFGVVMAIGRRDGMSMDRYLLTGLLHCCERRVRVAAPEEIPAPPGWCRVRTRLPAPLGSPVRAVRDDGVLELADGGTAMIVQAGTVAFALRSAAEQAGLVAAFGRWLNSLDASVQIVAQARPVDLTELIDRLESAAEGLVNPELRHAATDHAGFLAELTGTRDLLSRRVLLIIREDLARHDGRPWPPGRRTTRRAASADLVRRRAEEAISALAGLGVPARLLDAPACATVLCESFSPGQAVLPGLAPATEIVTGPEVMA